jgi:hypothetical protein
MKISKTALLVLGVGIFIIGFAALFTLYSGQSGEQVLLNKDLAASQSLLPQLIAEKEDFTGQLAQWQGELDKAMLALSKSEGRFPKSVESIEYDEVIFKLAADCDLMIMELSAFEPYDEKVEDTDIVYSVVAAEVKVQNTELPPRTVGDYELYVNDTVDKMLEFIHLIAASEEFNISTIRLVAIENLEPPEAEALEGAETDAARRELAPEATIQLLIYGFPR